MKQPGCIDNVCVAVSAPGGCFAAAQHAGGCRALRSMVACDAMLCHAVPVQHRQFAALPSAQLLSFVLRSLLPCNGVLCHAAPVLPCKYSSSSQLLNPAAQPAALG